MLDLKRRIDNILAEIDAASPAERAALFAHLERAVAGMDEEAVPQAAREKLDANRDQDSDSDDRFDNMPV